MSLLSRCIEQLVSKIALRQESQCVVSLTSHVVLRLITYVQIELNLFLTFRLQRMSHTPTLQCGFLQMVIILFSFNRMTRM